MTAAAAGLSSRGRMSRVTAIRAATLMVLFAAWEALARSGLVYEGVVPPLLDIILGLTGIVTSAAFYANAAVTVYEIAAALLIGVSAGILVGVACGSRRLVGDAAAPYLNALATTPKIVFLPIIMLALGVDTSSKIALGAVSGFFPVAISTAAGVRHIRPTLVRVGRSFHLNSWQMLTKIYLPAVAQPIVSGIRLGLGVTIIGVLLGEIKLSNAGLGFLANQYYNQYRIADLYAVLLLIFVLAVVINIGLGRIARQVRSSD